MSPLRYIGLGALLVLSAAFVALGTYACGVAFPMNSPATFKLGAIFLGVGGLLFHVWSDAR